MVKEGGKFEELVVASNEIAASTAQLVSFSLQLFLNNKFLFAILIFLLEKNVVFMVSLDVKVTMQK